MFAILTSSPSNETIRRGNRLEQRPPRTPDAIEPLGGRLIADDERFDLGDAPLDHLQPEHEDSRGVRFADGAHEHGLPCIHVGDRQRVAPFSGHRAPGAITEHQPLSVLREPDVFGRRQARGLMCHEGVHIPIEETLRHERSHDAGVCARACASSRRKILTEATNIPMSAGRQVRRHG